MEINNKISPINFFSLFFVHEILYFFAYFLSPFTNQISSYFLAVGQNRESRSSKERRRFVNRRFGYLSRAVGEEGDIHSSTSMASGFVVSSQARVTSNFAVASIPRVLSTKCRNSLISSQLCSSRAPSNRFFCECSHLQDPVNFIKYKEVFSRRMAMAGLKPHHRIGHSLTSHSPLAFLFFSFWLLGKCWEGKEKKRTEVFQSSIFTNPT